MNANDDPVLNTATERKFFDAIQHSDAVAVRKMIAGDSRLLKAYDRSAFGATPLTSAISRDDRDMIGILIDSGASLDQKSDWSMGPWSPTHTAIYGGNDELARHLLERGATVDVHTAAALGMSAELTALLDEAQERVGEQGGDGCQPLHFAGTEETAKILLNCGADIDARCVDHFSTPVQHLCHPRPAVARYLFLQGANPDIFSAAIAGATDVVKELIDANPDVLSEVIDERRFPPGPVHNVQNVLTFVVCGGATPLHAAAKAGQIEVVKQLVAAGLDVDVRGGYDNATALHMAAWDDRPTMVEALIECGSDIDARSGKIHNNSPAGWAIVAGSADTFELLLDNGADVLDWFEREAQAAVNGDFRQYKCVPEENYRRIQECLRRRLV